MVGSLLLVLLAVAVLVLVTRQVLVNGTNARIDALLEQEVAELRSLASGTDPETGEPFGPDVSRLFTVYLQRNTPLDNEAMLTFVDGRPFLRSAQAMPYRLDTDADLVARWTSIDSPQRGRVDTPAGGVDYLAVPLLADGQTAGTFVAAVFRQPELNQVDTVTRVSATVGALVVLLGGLLAWRLSDQVLTPVHGLIDTSRSISETDLSRRIEVTGEGEVAELAMTFNDMLDRLASAFATQRRFIDDASHELKTPITAIRGHLELLGDDPDERRETLEIVTDELDRMTRIVNDLLLLAKAQRPDFVRPTRIDVVPLMRDLHARATGLAERDWRTDIDVDAGTQIDGDRDRLIQALLQLAQNAAQHTQPGDPIVLAARTRDGSIDLLVSDRGPGVPLDEQAAIFERFHRTRHSPERTGNAGLGLAIVRAIAEAHDGHATVDSQPGRGATFTIRLPRASATP